MMTGNGGGKVLIVDDNPDFREMVKRMLTRVRSDLRFEEAGDGSEAAAKILDFRPELTIMDWDLPKMNGLQVCAWVEGLPEGLKTRVLAVTGREMGCASNVFRFAGAKGFVRKSAVVEELVPCVNRLLPASA